MSLEAPKPSVAELIDGAIHAILTDLKGRLGRGVTWVGLDATAIAGMADVVLKLSQARAVMPPAPPPSPAASSFTPVTAPWGTRVNDSLPADTCL